jgi:membrane protein implicated in regulation of membrane protease activity
METFISALPFDLRYLWLLLGAACMALEAIGISGVGLVFGGLAALLVGVLIEAGVIPEAHLVLQLALWFAFTALSAALLFKPFKKWRTSPESEDKFDNMIGTTARVAAGGLMIGKPGKVYWSGTTMNAQVMPDSPVEAFLEDDIVLVSAVKGNQLMVSALPPASSEIHT